MGKIGAYRDNYTTFEITGINDDNIVLSQISMPNNGWIKSFGVHAGGEGSDISAELILLNRFNNQILHRSGTSLWSSVLGVREYTLPTGGRRVRDGDIFKAGFWAEPGKPRKFSTVNRAGGKHQRTTQLGSTITEPIGGLLEHGIDLGAWIDFIPNRVPPRGTWRIVPSGLRADSEFRMSGNLPMHSAEEGFDHPANYRIIIYDRTLGRIVLADSFPTTEIDRSRGYFDSNIGYPHVSGHEYYVEFDFADSFGERADFSPRSAYSITNGPNQPDIERPAETNGTKLDWVSPATSPWGNQYIYGGSYEGRGNEDMGWVQVEVWSNNITDKDGVKANPGNRMWDSGKVPRSSTNVGMEKNSNGNDIKWFMKTFHPNYSWGRKMLVRARNWTSDNRESPWSPWRIISTNTAPFIPSEMEPSKGRATASGVLAATVRDPDGDQLQWVKFKIIDSVTGVPLVGHENGVTRSGLFRSGTRVEYDATTELGVRTGKRYEWVAWTNDGILSSSESAPQQFIYSDVPDIGITTPGEQITNLIHNPGLEVDTGETGRGWILDTASNSLTMEIVEDGMADGRWAMEVVRSNAATLGGLIRSKERTIDPTKAVIGFLAVRGMDGTADSTVSIVFTDVNGAVLGRVTPTQIGGGLNLQNPQGYWNRYGGYVAPASFPAGTVKAAVEIVPSNSQLATIRIDDAFLMSVPSGVDSTVILDWVGYISGDRRGYGVEDDYVFDNDDVALSTSTGPPILTNPEGSLAISYNATNAKEAHRTLVDELSGVGWRRVFDSGWVSSTLNTISMPPGLLLNQRRHRVRVDVRSTNKVVASSTELEFDVDYTGPAPLNVLSVGSDSTRGAIDISWETSELDPLEFIAYEVRIVSDEEGDQIIHRITNQETTTAAYHSPLSGVNYDIDVRQVQAVGPGEVQSRWNGDSVFVDYFPYYFIKDLDNPEILVPFDPNRGSIPGHTSNTTITEYEGFFDEKPRHIASHTRYGSGSFEFDLPDYDDLPLNGYDYLKSLVQIDRGLTGAGNTKRRRALILSHLPSTKSFVVLKGVDYNTNEFLEPSISIEWTETSYIEDLYKREGKTNG